MLSVAKEFKRSRVTVALLAHFIKLSFENVLSPEATLTGIVINILSAEATSSYTSSRPF